MGVMHGGRARGTMAGAGTTANTSTIPDNVSLVCFYADDADLFM